MAPKGKNRRAVLDDDIPSEVDQPFCSASVSAPDERRAALLSRVTSLISDSHLPHASELSSLLGLADGTPLPSVLLTGPAHAQKIAVLECLLESELAVFIDCQVANVYNSILRKLALKLSISTKVRNRFIPTCSWSFWQTARWAEVGAGKSTRSVAFREKLYTLLKFDATTNTNPIYLVLNNAHYLDAKMYSALMTICQGTHRIVLVFVTSRLHDIMDPPCHATVQMPGLGLKDLVNLLRRELAVDNSCHMPLLEVFLAALLPHMRMDLRNDVRDLLRQGKRIWRLVNDKIGKDILESLENLESLKVKVNLIVSGELRFETRCARESEELGERICPLQSLGVLAARTVVAAFAAAHNPPASDIKIFVAKKTRLGGAKRHAAAYKEGRNSAVEISCRAPEPFGYGRLLAILEYICEGELGQDAELLFTIKSLCDQGLLVRCGTNNDWLDGNLKFSCHASHEFVTELAKHHNINLREIVY